jgi:hypothetical protein
MRFIDKPAKWNVLKGAEARLLRRMSPLTRARTWLPVLAMADLVGAKLPERAVILVLCKWGQVF